MPRTTNPPLASQQGPRTPVKCLLWTPRYELEKFAKLLCHSTIFHIARHASHQEGLFIGFKPRRLDALEANKVILEAPSRWKHMFFRLLAKGAEFHQEFLNRLIRPGIRRKSLHLRRDVIEGVWLEIIPQGAQNHPHVTAGHNGVASGVVRANLSRGGIHMRNQ